MSSFKNVKEYINESIFDDESDNPFNYYTAEPIDGEESVIIRDYRKKSESNGKYYLDLTQKKKVGKRTIYRIVAGPKINVPGVKEGDFGGWIESYANLSMDGKCWVAENAIAMMNAYIYEDAKISGEAKCFGRCEIHGKAHVYGKAMIYGDSSLHSLGVPDIFDNARIFGSAIIGPAVDVFGNTNVSGEAYFKGLARLKSGSYTEKDNERINSIDKTTIIES